MGNFDFQPFLLYWGMIWAVVGSAVTPLRFDHANRSPWRGAVAGLVVGVVSAEIFGWLIIKLLYASLPELATGLSMLGGLVLLVPLWRYLQPLERTAKQSPGFVSGTITPLIFYLAVLSVFPLLWALLLAFFDYSPRNAGGPILGLGGNNPFIGLENFRDMLVVSGRDARIFRTSLSNTMLFTTLVLPLNLLITIPLATLIETAHRRLKLIFRTIYFLPVVTSSVGVAVMWGYIFHAQYGILNDALSQMGLTPVAWLQDQNAMILGLPAAMVAVVVAYLWQDFGYNLIVFIAALQNIPESLKDAARVDGANSWQTFWYITLPLLRPTIMVASVLTVMSSFQVFDIIQVMTAGGPGRIGNTRVLVLDIYENAFRYEKMGWAAAISLVLFGLVAVLTVIQVRVLRTEWDF